METTGLIYADLLDGQGGARKLGWEDVEGRVDQVEQEVVTSESLLGINPGGIPGTDNQSAFLIFIFILMWLEPRHHLDVVAPSLYEQRS